MNIVAIERLGGIAGHVQRLGSELGRLPARWIGKTTLSKRLRMGPPFLPVSVAGQRSYFEP